MLIYKVIVKQIDHSSVSPSVAGITQTKDDKFELLQFHFHWGFNNYQGSEHQIDYEKYPLEVREMYFLDKYKFSAERFSLIASFCS